MSQSFVQEPGRAGSAAKAGSVRSGWVNTLQIWLGRRRGRQELSSLDDRMLNDIGISREDALWKAGKPFWKP
jgi:uncharacterized protein YjiS (DUF1127 family)